LENHVLKLGEKLVPPTTSYTQSGSDPGVAEENEEGPEEEGVAGKPVKTNINEGGRPPKE
jgi:hypothetical protein